MFALPCPTQSKSLTGLTSSGLPPRGQPRAIKAIHMRLGTLVTLLEAVDCIRDQTVDLSDKATRSSKPVFPFYRQNTEVLGGWGLVWSFTYIVSEIKSLSLLPAPFPSMSSRVALAQKRRCTSRNGWSQSSPWTSQWLHCAGQSTDFWASSQSDQMSISGLGLKILSWGHICLGEILSRKQCRDAPVLSGFCCLLQSFLRIPESYLPCLKLHHSETHASLIFTCLTANENNSLKWRVVHSNSQMCELADDVFIQTSGVYGSE